MIMMVSIIASLYKTEKHLKRFLQEASVLSADLSKAGISHEIILVANDSSAEERGFLKPLQVPFIVLQVPREPIYASWNRGVRHAQGDFVTFWGVDDTRHAPAISQGVTELYSTNADIAYFPFRYHRFISIWGFLMLAKIRIFMPPLFDKERFTREMHLGPHFMVRRSLFERIGYFDESFRIAGDFEFQTRSAQQGAHFIRIPIRSGIFRNDGTTLSGSRAALHSEENTRIMSLHGHNEV